MKLVELFEHSSVNPFVGLVSAVDLKIKMIEAAGAGKPSSIFKSSLTGELNNLLKFITSGYKWTIPEPKLRSSFHRAIPSAVKQVEATIKDVEHGDLGAAKHELMSARKLLIKNSGLTFGDIE